MFNYVYLASLCIALTQNLVFPTMHQKECTQDAVKRGWPLWLIYITRVSFFTLFSQSLLLFVLFAEDVHRELAVIAMVMETNTFILYHLFISVDAELLSYHDPQRIKSATSCIPPMDRMSLVWIMLHVQHTLCPLHLWFYGGVEHRPEDVWWSMITMIVYVGWNHFCWRVQGKPTYPFQKKLLEKGIYVQATGVLFIMNLYVAVYCDMLL